MAEARLRQIDLDNQRSQQQRLHQKEQQEYVRREVSSIGKGLTKDQQPSAALQFLDSKPAQDFPIRQQPYSFNQQKQTNKPFNSRLRAPQQFPTHEPEPVSQTVDALDLGSSIKPPLKNYNQGPRDRAKVGELLESLNLQTGIQGLLDKRRAHPNYNHDQDDSDDEMQEYRKELESPNMLQESIRQSIQEWKQVAYDQGKSQKRGVPMRCPQEFKQLHSQEPEPPVEFEVVKPQFNQPSETGGYGGYARIHKNQYIQKPKPPVAASRPPPKPQSVISGVESQSSQARGSRADSAARKALLQSDILSKEDEAKLAREKKIKLDEIKKKYSGKAKGPSSRAGSQASRGSAAHSRDRSQGSQQRDTTKCTRDEDLNIEEFMREDMRQINKDEDRLQRELMSMHQKNLGKHAKVLQKFRIDTSLKNTEDLLRRMMCLPKSSQGQDSQRRALHQGKSAVNKRPEEFRSRPDAGEDGQVDLLLNSIENLDKLLANLTNGKKETVLEQLCAKVGISLHDEDVQTECNYSGRPSTAKADRQPTSGQVPLAHPAASQMEVIQHQIQQVQQKVAQVQQKPAMAPPVPQLPQKQIAQKITPQKPEVVVAAPEPKLLELKESSLKMLDQKYQQPFSVPGQFLNRGDNNDDDQFSQAPTAKPMSKISSSTYLTRPPVHAPSSIQQPSPRQKLAKYDPSPKRQQVYQASPQRQQVYQPSPQRQFSGHQKPSAQRQSVGTPQISQQKLPSPVNRLASKQPSGLFPQINPQNSASNLFPPIAGQAPMTPSSQAEKASMMDSLMEQQRVLQENIDNMVKMQREQSSRSMHVQDSPLGHYYNQYQEQQQYDQRPDSAAEYIQQPQRQAPSFHPEPSVHQTPPQSSTTATGRPPQAQQPRGAWKQEQVKVNPNFNPKLLFDSP